MGDKRVQLQELPQDLRTGAQEDPSARLHDNAYQGMRRAGSDNTQTHAQSIGKTFDNPYDHIAVAGAALREFESLKDLPAKDKVQVQDGKGQIREVTVEDRRLELAKLAESQFNQGISAADRIDQNKVSQMVMTLKEKIEKETDPTEKAKLQQTADVVDSMKHAPSVTRFAYATFLADGGDFARAKVLLDQAADKDKEAKNDPVFKKVFEKVEAELKARQDQITEGNNPLAAWSTARDKRAAGDIAGAEAEYKRALDLAGKVDAKVVEQNLKQIQEDKTANANNPDKLKELEQKEKAWTAMAHAGAIVSMDYADMLNDQKRYKEAKDLLLKVGMADPQFVKDNKEFGDMLQKARNEGKAPEAFDNPFAHLTNVQELAKKEDMGGVRRELEAAVKAADKIDRKMMQDNKAVIDAQLKEEKDPTKRKELQDMREAYDQFDHAAAFARVCLARFEIANKNYNTAQTLLAQAESDQTIVNKPDIKFAELKEASIEPSTWDKVWGCTKSILKELVCDGVAILAGAGAVILTGWSGPAALVAGGCAGAAAYTGMKTLVFGEEFSWTMPIWGAVDGVTGGTAALARTALAKVGGKIVTKEIAESMAAKTGADLTKLAAKEGTMAYGKAVQQLGKEGLKELAKKENLSLFTRMTSHVGLGNAQYRAGLNALRGVTVRNLAAESFVNGGTALTGSVIYRGVHDGVDYNNGKYTSFGDFASNYGQHVLFDTTKGMGVGAFQTSFGYGSLTSFALNGGREALTGNNKNLTEWAVRSGLGTMNDMVLSMPGTIVNHGRLGNFLNNRMPNFMDALNGGYVAATPEFYQAWEANARMQEVQQRLAECQKAPENDGQLQENYFNLPGTDEYPTDKPEDNK
jgi:hypothetical protein